MGVMADNHPVDNGYEMPVEKRHTLLWPVD